MNNERLLHSIKTAIAVTIGFSLTRVVSFAYAQWIIITILVVMCAQIYVGGALQKAYLRFLGTLCGCGIAIVIIELFHSSDPSVFLALVISSFVFSYIATSSKESLSYFGTMGCVTLAIILLGKKDSSLNFATARFLEISIGIIIASVVSQFVFPIPAKKQLRKNQTETLTQLREFYNKTLVMGLAEVQTVGHHDLDEEIVKLLLKQRQLAKQSGREPFGGAFNVEHFTHSLFCERQILRAINFMHLAQDKLRSAKLSDRMNLLLKTFHEEVLTALDAMAESTPEKTKSFKLPSLDAIQHLRVDSKEMLVLQPVLYFDALIFNAEIIVENIALLAKLYIE
jgi:uncharacterized membrane protein YccC